MDGDFSIVEHAWLRVPDDFSLVDQSAWKTSTKKRFGAVRKVYLILKRKSVEPLNGPILLRRTLPEGAEVKYERKVSVVAKRIDAISASVQRTISSKLASELSTKLNAELGLFPVPGLAKIGGEVQSKITAEFTSALTTYVSSTRSFEVTNLEEFTSSVSLKTPGRQSPSLKYFFFLPVHLCYWDIYLYKQETLEFTYRTKLFLWNERQDEKYDGQDLKVPLARIVFYEPVDDFPSFEVEGFKPDVVDGSRVTVEKLVEPCPTVTYDETTLQELAVAAFPATSEEEMIRSVVRAKFPKPKTREDKIVEKLTRSLPSAPSRDYRQSKARKKKSSSKKISRSRSYREPGNRVRERTSKRSKR